MAAVTRTPDGTSTQTASTQDVPGAETALVHQVEQVPEPQLETPLGPLAPGSMATRVAAPVGVFLGGATAAALGGAAVAMIGTAASMVVSMRLDPLGLHQIDLAWAAQAGIGGAVAATLGAIAGTIVAANATRAAFNEPNIAEERPKLTGIKRLFSGWFRTAHETKVGLHRGRREYDEATSMGGAIVAGGKASAKAGYEVARVAGRWAGAVEGMVLAGMTSGAMGLPIAASAAASLAGAVAGAVAMGPVAGGIGGAFSSMLGSITAFAHRLLFGGKTKNDDETK